jgi:hypothetical protein
VTPAEIARVFDWYSADLLQNYNFSTGNPSAGVGSVKILKTSHASSLSDVFIVADPDYYPNIREIFHIPLTMPIESVPCERPFSALRRLKQRNRTTMVEDRLHGLALLHIYREVNVDSVKILDKFDTGNRRIGALYL